MGYSICIGVECMYVQSNCPYNKLGTRFDMGTPVASAMHKSGHPKLGECEKKILRRSMQF